MADLNEPIEPTKAIVAKKAVKHGGKVDQRVTSRTIGDIRYVIAGREEIPLDPKKVEDQIKDYVTIIRHVADSAHASSGGIKLQEMKVGLTLGANGNIGFAPNSSEAGIEVVFKR